MEEGREGGTGEEGRKEEREGRGRKGGRKRGRDGGGRKRGRDGGGRDGGGEPHQVISHTCHVVVYTMYTRSSSYSVQSLWYIEGDLPLGAWLHCQGARDVEREAGQVACGLKHMELGTACGMVN